jgi:hypothetical protein
MSSDMKAPTIVEGTARRIKTLYAADGTELVKISHTEHEGMHIAITSVHGAAGEVPLGVPFKSFGDFIADTLSDMIDIAAAKDSAMAAEEAIAKAAASSESDSEGGIPE